MYIRIEIRDIRREILIQKIQDIFFTQGEIIGNITETSESMFAINRGS